MILCAAMKIIPLNLIVPCRRHGEGYEIIKELTDNKYGVSQIEDGFIDTNGHFRNRIEAFNHATICGQISPTVAGYKLDHNETELYSEDLY